MNYNLTQKEITVLKLLIKGFSNGEICKELGVVESTVKFHVSKIIKKFKVRNRTEAVTMGIKFLKGYKKLSGDGKKTSLLILYHKIEQIIDNEQKLKYMILAYDACFDKKSLQQLKDVVSGMELISG